MLLLMLFLVFQRLSDFEKYPPEADMAQRRVAIVSLFVFCTAVANIFL